VPVGDSERSQVSLDHRIKLLDVAIRGYQHAEAVVQARLYNFLFADSILLLSWAAVYAGPSTKYEQNVLLILALLSAVLGLCWSIMGTRHRKFLFVNMQIIVDIEAPLPKELKVNDRIARLQNGEEVAVNTGEERRLQLTWLEKCARSRNLGIWAPRLMAAVSLFLVLVSLKLDR
jgi:hypothetical protein